MNGNSKGCQLRIAVVGAGVAGITAAHILQRKHDVTLFEKNSYVGGHTNTITINDGPDEGTPVDTGFIVLNDRTYPTFHKFLNQLQVSHRNSDMSFGFHCEQSSLQYSGCGLKGIFADKRNLFRPSYWQMLNDIKRFNKTARHDLLNHKVDNISLREYLENSKYSKQFQDDYLIPMGSAIWSTSADAMLEIPAITFLRFFHNHGLLTLSDRPQWQTVMGGSHTYVKAFLNQFSGRVEKNSQIINIDRTANSITIHCKNREPQIFDRLVLGVHADQVLSLVADPTTDEQDIFSCWSYTHNHTVLHTDESVMPPNKNAWASWNYTREKMSGSNQTLSLTYHMNRLQGLNTRNQYFVTLNRKQAINSNAIIREFNYTHPLFTEEAVATQDKLPMLYGRKNTYYCGSYFGFGFHEDAVKSGVRVAESMGMEL